MYLCVCARACAVFVFHTLKICLFKSELQKSSKKIHNLIQKTKLVPDFALSLF